MQSSRFFSDPKEYSGPVVETLDMYVFVDDLC